MKQAARLLPLLFLPAAVPGKFHGQMPSSSPDLAALMAAYPSIHACMHGGNYRSQSKQDLVLSMLTWYATATGKWPSNQPRVFFEAGGLDGVTWSNTLFLERCLGWKGLLLEGSPSSSALMLRNRPADVNVHMAICPKPGFVKFMYSGMGPIAGDSSHLHSGFQERYATKAARLTQPVPCMPLQSVFDAGNFTHFDVFALDVEGAELTALQTIDWTRTTIDIAIVELRGARYGERNKDIAVREFLDDTAKTGLCRLPASPQWFRDEVWVSRATFGPLCDMCRAGVSAHDMEVLPVEYKPSNDFETHCFLKAQAAALEGSNFVPYKKWVSTCGYGLSKCA
ncbi:hypothetical protein AB1Y20_001800 [Prymnesium parvum]|uniref:Methyltransferase FkbM domain-containing protein n=1 Tax=Prymnesium parvum TaxID=97485 RepID=A0AB34K8T5_PRYPA